MNKLVLVIQIALALAFALFGIQKLAMPIADLVAQGMTWAGAFAVWQVRAIGFLELLGALGLILPYVIKPLPKLLVPAAALGLALLMLGALGTHFLRGDPAVSFVFSGLFLLLSSFIALKRAKEIKHA